MDRNSTAHPTDPPAGADPPAPLTVGADEQRERLRTELLAAAEEESAAIVENARREITTAVRRARRDLHLVRAQLHLCGVELPGAAADDWHTPELPEGVTRSSLAASVPRDAILVGRPALRHVVTEARSELADLSAALPVAPATAAFSVNGEPASPPVVRGWSRRVAVAAAAVLALLVSGAAAWWTSSRGGAVSNQSQPGAGVTSGSVAAAQRGDAGRADVAAAASGADVAAPPRILLQTVRPVWMRIEVDDQRDAGHLYPAGETRELNPTDALLIRAGDAGAVLLSERGGPMAPLGPAGQVVTRRIAVADARAPVSAAPAGSSLAPVSPPAATSAPVGRAVAAETPPEEPAATPVVPAPPARIPAAAPADPVVSAQHAEILARHTQWLNAVARGDRNTIRALTTEGFSLRDDRIGPGGTQGVPIAPAQLSDVRVDVAGVGAVLSARIRPADGGQSESLLSEVWVRNDQQQWSLMGVRITPVDRRP